MKIFDETNHANNLPDCYAKPETSNNYKLLQTEKSSVDRLKNDINSVFDILDLNKAEGTVLDLYGDMVNQQRGLATDLQYRFMIRSKIMQNLSNGDYGSVLKALYMTFNCKPSQVSIETADTPCTVKVAKVPLDEILKAGFSTGQTIQLIKALLPVGVDIESYFFEGTFEFGSTDNEYDELKGFGSIDQTIGGFLGVLFGKTDNFDLPI